MKGTGEPGEIHVKARYWRLEGSCSLPRINVFTVPKYEKFPFLDPHYIVRVDGTFDLGPTVSLSYDGFDYDSGSMEVIMRLILHSSLGDLKGYLSLLKSGMLSLLLRDGLRMFSSEHMRRFFSWVMPWIKRCELVAKPPGIMHYLLNEQGIDQQVRIEEVGQTLHVLNYDAPGATGAPYFSYYIVRLLLDRGYLSPGKGLRYELWRTLPGS